MSCSNAKCRNRREIRVQLAMFACVNYLLGMGTFMFFLCSASNVHRGHLEHLFRDPMGYFSPGSNHEHHHSIDFHSH